ncbi:MAG: hypothetical protein ACQES8_08755, partial [Thermodesulfobacteriota bacterium]
EKMNMMLIHSQSFHLSCILFLDALSCLFFYHYQQLHLVLFWITTIAAVFGMFFCFYADGVMALIKRGH